MRARFLVFFSSILLASFAVSVAGCKHEDSEAKAEATKVLDGLVSKCGDKYYTWDESRWNHHHEGIIEMMEKPRLAVQDDPHIDSVSDVDRMNGLTWSGGWSFTSSAHRTLLPHKISPWEEGGPWYIGIRKLNGVWLFPNPDYTPEAWQKSIPIDSFSDNVPCEKVSEYYSQEGVSRNDSQ